MKIKNILLMLTILLFVPTVVGMNFGSRNTKLLDVECDSIKSFSFEPEMSVIMDKTNREVYRNVSDGKNFRIIYEYNSMFICYSKGKLGLVSEEGIQLLPNEFDNITSNGVVLIASKDEAQTIYSADLSVRLVDKCSDFVFDPSHYVYSEENGKMGVQILDAPFGIPFVYDSILTIKTTLKGGTLTSFAFCYLNDSLHTYQWNSDSIWKMRPLDSRLEITRFYKDYILVRSPDNLKYGALDLLLEQVVPLDYEELSFLNSTNYGLLFAGRKSEYIEFIKHDSILGSIRADSIIKFTDFKSVVAYSEGVLGIYNFSGQRLNTIHFDEIVARRGKYLYRLRNEFGILNDNYQPLDSERVTCDYSSFQTLEEIEQSLIAALKAEGDDLIYVFAEKLHASYRMTFDLITEGRDHILIKKDPCKELFLQSLHEFVTSWQGLKAKLHRIDPGLETLKVIGFESDDFRESPDKTILHASPLIIELDGQQYDLHLGKLIKLESGVYSMTLPKSFKR